MSEEHHTHRHHHAITLGLALIALVAACLLPLLMRDQVLAEMHEATRTLTSEQQKLTTKIDGLKATLESLGNKTTPDAESIAEIKRNVAETSTMIEVLGARVDEAEKKMLEKQLAPAPLTLVAPTPSAAAHVTVSSATGTLNALKLLILRGDAYATELAAWEKVNANDTTIPEALRMFAQSGIPTEATLIRDLRAALPAVATAAVAEDVSLIGKINTHMVGLVSIKKKSPDNDAYAPLRHEIDRANLDTLIHTTEQLDSTARAPFTAWLKTATARAEALSALATLEPKTGL